jgi:hypothetical protein
VSPCGSPMFGSARAGGMSVYRCARSRAEYGQDRCDCRRISMADVDGLVVGAVRERCGDLDWLLAASGCRRQLGVVWSDLLERSVERQTGRLAQRLVEELTAGECRDAEEVMVLLSDGQRRLERTRARVLQAERRSLEHRKLERMHQQLCTVVGDADRLWIETFDVQVRVSGWVRCGKCEGHGTSGGGAGSAGFAGDVCPSCSRMRWLPTMSVSVGFPAGRRVDILRGSGGDGERMAG